MAGGDDPPTLVIKLLQINITNVQNGFLREVRETAGVSPESSFTPTSDSEEAKGAFVVMLVVGMVITIIVTITGVVGNLLSLAAIFYQFQLPRRKRYVVKMTGDLVLLMNLSLADLCYSGVSLPVMFMIYKNIYQNIDEFADYPAMEDSVCEWAAFLRYTNAITEWTTLGLMALERCVTIYRFQRKLRPSQVFTPFKTLTYCVALWIMGMVAQTPTLAKEFGSFGYNMDTLKCDFMPTINKTIFITPRTFFFTLESAFPCCCIFTGYVIILFQVYSNTRFWRGNSSITSSTQISLALRRSRTTRLIVMLLTIYLICVIPICVYNIAVSEEDMGKQTNQIIGIALYCIYWLQYGINNFIYVVSHERFRNAYHQLFCFLMCKEVLPPPRLNHLKMPYSKRICQTETTKSFSRMRFRTPSEMFMECTEEIKPSKTWNTRITFISGSSDLELGEEGPIMFFPKAKLNSSRSSFRKKCHWVNKKMQFTFNEFKWNKRRLSLNDTDSYLSKKRKRSLSI